MEYHEGKDIQLRKAIGMQVSKQLKVRKMTQEKAALKADITDAQMSSVVNGNRNYTVDTLIKIAIAINIKIKLNTKILTENESN